MIAGIAALLVFDRVREMIAASTILPEFTISRPEVTPTVPFDPLKVPRWEGVERVNILLMGIDQRDYEQGPWRTDTMIVLTIDPVTLSAGMLSIPRDMWVPIPGFQEGRINTAHYLGEVYDYPGGGPALAVKTVEYNLGVPIHYYVRANFTAFEQLVDMIGGIDIEVKEEINDPLYPERDGPGYDPLYIPAGLQHFDGEMALKYARTRHSLGGDFDRARRQQQVMLAVFDKVTRLDMLPSLMVQAPQLWQTLQGSVVTDLTLEQIIALANLAKEVPPENIRYSVIDEEYTQFWTTPDQQQVLIPLRDKMRELRDYVFTNPMVLSETEDPVARLQSENASIEVLNGTQRTGLARSTADYLEQHGLRVGQVGDAEPDESGNPERAVSLVIVHTGKVYTAEVIVRLLGLPETALVHGANDPTSVYDITVILGQDYELPATPTPATG
jgi:LCP family protein required for cell wall assembly